MTSVRAFILKRKSSPYMISSFFGKFSQCNDKCAYLFLKQRASDVNAQVNASMTSSDTFILKRTSWLYDFNILRKNSQCSAKCARLILKYRASPVSARVNEKITQCVHFHFEPHVMTLWFHYFSKKFHNESVSARTACDVNARVTTSMTSARAFILKRKSWIYDVTIFGKHFTM